jgi:NAD(P)-dependent dehydrogenase (short-subunit alcohol dehydrogenase family)
MSASGQLAGKVALITGASRGIGRAVAELYAREGAEVICVARTQGALEELDDDIGKAGGKAILVPIDLTEENGIERIAAAVWERFGRLDILVGNAGTLGGGLTPVSHMEPRDYRRIFDLNVTANWRLMKAFEPHLRKAAHGRALFVTDAAAHANTPFWGVYAASKAALECMVLTWAAEIAGISAVRANLIDPGPTATRLRAQAFPGENAALLPQPMDVALSFVPPVLGDYTKNGIIHLTN